MMNALVHFLLDGLQLTHVRPASHGWSLQEQHHQQDQQHQGNMLQQDEHPRLRVVWALRSNRAGYQQQILGALQKRLPVESNAEVGLPVGVRVRCPAQCAPVE